MSESFSPRATLGANAAVARPDYPLLGGYSAAPGAYDEVFDGTVMRPHWAAWFQQATGKRPGTSADQVRNAHHIAHVDAERPWHLDSMPLLLDQQEWRELEIGLTQRARVLNAVVADLYEARTLLSDGGLPPALVYGNTGYLHPSTGYQSPDREHLQLIAFDIARSPDGQWRVLSNRCEAPSGLGVCLENRITLARALPELFNRSRVWRIDRLLAAYRAHLERLGDMTGIDGSTAILSDAPTNSRYFETAYLGRYFGYPVVEGSDLTVRDGRVFLKTIGGLKPVNVLLRHLASNACDPLELDSTSRTGVPGLLNTARNGRVLLSNAVGAGVVENEAIMGFLPGLTERFLDEELQLPSLATWWCGQPEVLGHVRENFSNLIVRRAFSSRSLLDSSVADYLAAESVSSDALTRTPYAYVGREPIQLSMAPYWTPQGQIAAAPMLLRLFVVATDNGYRLLPSGVARLSTPEGDITKDLWLPLANSEITASVSTGTRTQATPILESNTDKELTSKTADHLFWLGRYIERAEGAVRAYRAFIRAMAEDMDYEQPIVLSTLTELLASLDYMSAKRAKKVASGGRLAIERELWSMVFDPDSKDGLTRVLGSVYRTANEVRERMSADAWRLFVRLSDLPNQRWQNNSLGDVLKQLDDLIATLSAVNGQMQENMTRSHGWRLLDLGRRIERAQFGIRVIRQLAVINKKETSAHLNLLLDVCDSTITYRSRYQQTPELAPVLHLLLMDHSNPRSVLYQGERIRRHMERLPGDSGLTSANVAERTLLAMTSELVLADPYKLAGVMSKAGVRTFLRRLLRRTEDGLKDLSRLITRTYFDHTSFEKTDRRSSDQN